MALQSISRDRKGRDTNLVLRSYYLKKCQSKPKMVALGAVMHKVCNIIFAILRDNKPFEIRTPEEHCLKYTKFKLQAA